MPVLTFLPPMLPQPPQEPKSCGLPFVVFEFVDDPAQNVRQHLVREPLAPQPAVREPLMQPGLYRLRPGQQRHQVKAVRMRDRQVSEPRSGVPRPPDLDRPLRATGLEEVDPPQVPLV